MKAPLVKSWFERLWEILAMPLGHRPIRLGLALMLLIDFALLGLFIAWARVEHYQLRESFFYGRSIFSVQDRGLVEIFGYLKEVAVCALLVTSYRVSRAPIYRSLVILVAVLLIDDSLSLHEALGSMLTRGGTPPWISEALAAAILGLLTIPPVIIDWYKAELRDRRHAEAILLVLGVLLFFGVFVDTVHGRLQQSIGGFETISSLLEDGGELVTLTLLLLFAIGVYLRVSVTPATHAPDAASLGSRLISAPDG